MTGGRLPLVAVAVAVALLPPECVGQHQRFRVRPQSVEVREGEDVFLECVVEHQQGKAQWTKDGFALGFERLVPGYPRYYYEGEAGRGEHHLLITGVTLTEDGEYQCQVGPTAVSPPIWTAANVTVILAPSSVTIVGWESGAVVEVMVGSSLTLECLVSDARPAPAASWYRAGRKVDRALQEDQVEASSLARRWSLRSQLVVQATPADNGKVFACHALHPALHDLPHALHASITLSVLHPPGPPTITGYETGEILLAGERRTLTCRVSGGNPRPWVLWYRDGRLVDDTTSEDAEGVYNAYQVAVTAEEGGAVYECSVTNDLLETPYTANVTLTVYYAPRTVTVVGPSQVQDAVTINLTCFTSVSNPPASLTWTVAGEMQEASKAVVAPQEDGGWISTSHLTGYTVGGVGAGVGGGNVSAVQVECRAVNPAIDHVVKKLKSITITQPPGAPRFLGDLRSEVIAGTTLEVTCSSEGGRPPPTLRIYKGGEALLTDLQRSGNTTTGQAQVQVTPGDNGGEVTCEATNTPDTAPPSASFTLSVLFAPWDVEVGSRPASVREGHEVTLTCHSSPSLPLSNLTWTFDGRPLHPAAPPATSPGAHGGLITRSEVRLRPRARDNGRAVVCTATNGLDQPVHGEARLDVTHAPIWIAKPPEKVDVIEGAELIVTAEALSNPGPVRYS